MAAASTLAEILSLLSEGSLVLTPNASSARALRSAFDAHQCAAGLAAWEPPPVLAFTQWTASLWTSLATDGLELRLLLNEAQEHTLWREIVSASADANLSSTDSLADLARSAFYLAAAHNATSRLRSTAATRDTRLFADWAEAFSKRCAQQQLLSSALLNEALRSHADSKALTPPPSLHLAGFLTLDPSQQSLLDSLEAKGCQLHRHALIAEPHAEPIRSELVAATEYEELTLAAAWTRRFLEQRAQQNLSARVAIILPTLAEDRSALEVALRETLAPELEDIAADLSSTPWEFSTGNPLSSLPLIADALDLARWSLDPLQLPRISSLLLSPYLGHSAGLDDAAILDAQILRRETLLRPELDLPSLLALLKRSKKFAKLNIALPAWLEDLRALLDKSPQLDKPNTFADWAEFIRSILRAVNWPGERPLSAAEFEATRSWESTLDLIATLDFNGRRIRFADALEALERQCRSTAFAPPSTNAPIQILTPEDSTGSFFDAALFLRSTDANWPRSERPNPLLSFTLQRDLRMTGTDAALTSSRALDLTLNLASRSSTLLFTRSAENADGPQRPSPILAHLDLSPIDADDLPSSALADPLPPDFIPDILPLPPLPSVEVHGGAALLKLQAACGFLAFAQLRLASSDLESRDAGLDPRESGNILHDTLQRFWKKVETRDNLSAMSEDDRERLLIQCIDASMPAQLSAAGAWDLAYLTLQKDRLRRLLLHWFNRELDRSPFTVVESESDQTIEVGPLTLKVRVDRMDKVDGGYVFVDYKTGYSGEPKEWIGDRPADPQLPLYALLFAPGELQALVFAKVRAGKEAKWQGYQSTAGIFSNSRPTIVDLDAQTDEWRSTLTRLAHDFFSGRASVSPRSFDIDCKRCAQRLLCRVNPESLLALLDDSEDSEAADA